MALATRGQKQAAVDQMFDPDLHGLIVDLGFIQARAAAPDKPARIALARDQAAAPEQLDEPDTPLEVCQRHRGEHLDFASRLDR